jgi:hypothetical protein
MGYTPAASRSGYQERGGEEKENQLSMKQAIDDGGRLPPPSSSSPSSMALVGSGMYKSILLHGGSRRLRSRWCGVGF